MLSHNHIVTAAEAYHQHLATAKTNLHFIGKVENFAEDMERLMNQCSDYFDVEQDARKLHKQISHQMTGFGWYLPAVSICVTMMEDV